MAIDNASERSDAVDLDWVKEHFNPVDQRLAGEGPLLGDGLDQAIDLMLEHCPIAHTDGQFIGSPTGAWVVNSYADVMSIIRDPETFSNNVQSGTRDDEMAMIPFHTDPPMLIEYRRLLRPYLTASAVSKYAPMAQEIIARLLDDVVESGRCENFVTEIAQAFSSEVQWGWLVGVGEVDQDQVMDWVMTWIHKHFEPEFDVAEKAWIDWIQETIARRRTLPRQDDLIDGLIHGEVVGRPLTDDEIVRIMMIMVLGGVTSTADTISNFTFRLAKDPELRERLRDDLSLLPKAIEEALRIEIPGTGHFRRATRDAEVGGVAIREGEQIFIHLAAANKDPEKFACPHQYDLKRQPNPHLGFGAGAHHCLGANFARQNLRIVFEQILTRFEDLHVADDAEPVRHAGIGWMMERLPLAFTPGPRIGSA